MSTATLEPATIAPTAILIAPTTWRFDWLRLMPASGGRMQKVERLISLFNHGFIIGQFKLLLNYPDATPNSIFAACGFIKVCIKAIEDNDPVPFASTLRGALRLKSAIDNLFATCRHNPGLWNAPLDAIYHHELNASISGLETLLAHDLDAMPIWLVTPRRAYSVDALVNNAETVLDTSDALLLSARTITDIRQAGRALAFDVPTAAGFHSVRAVESVARGYHTVLLGNAPKDGEPLGPLLNTLRDKRDALTASKAINKDDLLQIIIETLARINNVFRKPLTHPDMVLDLSGAMTVFDSSKCAIELMLSDARKKCATPITNGFF